MRFLRVKVNHAQTRRQTTDGLEGTVILDLNGYGIRYKKLQKMVKAANKALKANKCTYTVNKASVTECQTTVKAGFTKSGKLKVDKKGNVIP